ncbi:hypothetical protein GR160_07615 [Flavobacterium sp. Sd200]|uniref:imelysin family protein n=1 Tax=Flavobacterium sp. Sd200 TaxID=2692211 RepID=UPI00136CE820|nr:imelysin family protein [Flavobacterium sp. Sd200]MXN91095.1 hypothetical protein [Flavobacterium sp. Sd200]
MKKITLTLSVLAAIGLTVAACSDDDTNNAPSAKAQAISTYADIVYQNYKDAYDDAVELEAAINDFTAAPTAAKFDIAKTKWKEARESYGPSEAFRFANGPIDAEDGPEGLLNSWPLDEAYIDYVVDPTTNLVVNGGIINDLTEYPNITKQVLVELNGAETEESVSVGYHAIEFLLWGQDLTDPADNKPGQRTFEDFVDNGTTASNEGRRRQYLNICADLLTDHLDLMVQTWKPGGEYRSTFLALNENEALANILLGIITLSDSELPTERMSVALRNQSQEDEHSCFSDNTHRDIILNLQGVINVYQGKYGNIDGASIEDLVAAANPQIAAAITTAINNAKTKVAAIPVPFDKAISGGEASADGAKVAAASSDIRALSQQLLAGAGAIGVTVNGID